MKGGGERGVAELGRRKPFHEVKIVDALRTVGKFGKTIIRRL